MTFSDFKVRPAFIAWPAKGGGSLARETGRLVGLC